MVEILLPLTILRADGGRPFSEEERRKAREAIASVIGHFMIEWCNLHEELSKLYVEVSGDMGSWKKWRTKKSDSDQRRLLVTEINRSARLNSDERADLNWLLNSIREIEDDRNNAAHTPYIYVRNGEEILCLPNWIFGDERAGKIAGSDFPAIAERRTVQVRSLSQFATTAASALRDRSAKRWPGRWT